MPLPDLVSKSDFVDLFVRYKDSLNNMKFWVSQVNSNAENLKLHPEYTLGLDQNEKNSLDQNISLVSSVAGSLQANVAPKLP